MTDETDDPGAGEAGALDGRTVAILAAPEGTEQIELTEPWRTVQQAGGTSDLVSTRPGPVQAFHHLDRGAVFQSDAVAKESTEADYDALILPGGVANPDFLRTDEDAVAFVRAFTDAGKPVAVICHGPWTLIEADAVRGRTLTSWPSLQTDLRNAGADWVDRETVVCDRGPGTIVSSRKPDDLPAFCRALVTVFARPVRA